jgi:hypothetical protein
MYFGSGSCKGSGASGCTEPADCCSGVCNADGTCGGNGGGLSNAVDFSSTSNLNGLFWAGYGELRTSNALTMYGSVFANYYDASGPTTIHYDRASTTIGDECPPPPDDHCESCRDCGNQACVGGTCGLCTSDGDCCQPLRCVGGTCKLSNGV